MPGPAASSAAPELAQRLVERQVLHSGPPPSGHQSSPWGGEQPKAKKRAAGEAVDIGPGTITSWSMSATTGARTCSFSTG